jgi:hypothetical protein
MSKNISDRKLLRRIIAESFLMGGLMATVSQVHCQRAAIEPLARRSSPRLAKKEAAREAERKRRKAAERKKREAAARESREEDAKKAARKAIRDEELTGNRTAGRKSPVEPKNAFLV